MKNDDRNNEKRRKNDKKIREENIAIMNIRCYLQSHLLFIII